MSIWAEAPTGYPVVWTPEDVARLDTALERCFGAGPLATPYHHSLDYHDGYWDDEIERQFHYEVKGG